MGHPTPRFVSTSSLSLLLAICPLATANVSAQTPRCATCHFANLSEVPSPGYLADWQRSAHARHGVACDKCHGGDPWTFEPVEAHRGVLPKENPSSPVHPANLSRTCAPCHERNALAFGTSRHQTLVQADERRAPTCDTCHGAMRARVPSPATLETRCATCHPQGSPLGEYPALMRAAAEALDLERRRADDLQDAIERLPDASRRVTLLVALHDASTVLKEAVASVHKFDVQGVNERLAAARQRLDALTASVPMEW